MTTVTATAERSEPRREVAVRLTVHGRVQGVGFRYFVRSLARELDLRGRVRNLASGAVEIEAAGPEPALAELSRRLLAEGPGHPAGIERQNLTAIPAWDRFEIDR